MDFGTAKCCRSPSPHKICPSKLSHKKITGSPPSRYTPDIGTHPSAMAAKPAEMTAATARQPLDCFREIPTHSSPNAWGRHGEVGWQKQSKISAARQSFPEGFHNTTQHNTTQHNTTQHNTTQHNTTQHNTTQHNTTQHNTTQHNTTQHNTTQHNTTQHNTTQHNTTQQNTTEHNTTQHNRTQRNTTQHNTTQHNTTEHNTTQHNRTQHNTTQHNTTQHNTTHTTPHHSPQSDSGTGGRANVYRNALHTPVPRMRP